MKRFKSLVSGVIILAIMFSIAACNSASSSHRRRRRDSENMLDGSKYTTEEPAISTVSDLTVVTTIPSATTYVATPTPTPTPSISDVSQSDKTTINVWSFSEELGSFIEYYAQTHPDFNSQYDINVTLTYAINNSYTEELDYALATGENAPDIFCLDPSFSDPYISGDMSSYVLSYDELGIDTETLIDEAQISPYVVQRGTRPSDGSVVALGWASAPNFFVYRRSIAVEVFGTDNPDAINTVIGGGTGIWDSFFNAAEDLSGYGYHIVSSNDDIWTSVFASAIDPWVVDGSLYIDPAREDFLNYSALLTESNWSNSTTSWSQEWANDYSYSNSDVFGYIGPSWFINYSMGLGNFDYDTNIQTYGDWGVCLPPCPSFWGGSWVAVSTNSSSEVREALAEVVTWLTLDATTDGFQYQFANGLIDDQINTVASSVVMNMSDGSMDGIGGQNLFEYGVEANSSEIFNNTCEYDEVINAFWRDNVISYVNGEFTRDEAIENFRNDVEFALGFV